jgi:hypothetical protein
MSNNPRYFNAAIAGIGGAAKSAWLTDSVAADYLAYTNAVNAAATAVDAAIAAVSGGATQAGADLLESICFAVFLQRNVGSTTSSDYSAVAASIAALFTELLLKQVAQPGGTSKLLSVVVPAITAPNTAQVDVTDSTFIGANTISAEFSGVPVNAQLGIQGQWVGATSSGQITISFVKVAGNFAGATEPVRVAVTS